MRGLRMSKTTCASASYRGVDSCHTTQAPLHPTSSELRMMNLLRAKTRSQSPRSQSRRDVFRSLIVVAPRSIALGSIGPPQAGCLFRMMGLFDDRSETRTQGCAIVGPRQVFWLVRRIVIDQYRSREDNHLRPVGGLQLSHD